jgi:hypothetical protein
MEEGEKRRGEGVNEGRGEGTIGGEMVEEKKEKKEKYWKKETREK